MEVAVLIMSEVATAVNQVVDINLQLKSTMTERHVLIAGENSMKMLLRDI
jgi:hypothetical protein